MPTPYANHARQNHRTTRHSPNGIDVVEECPTCGVRFIHEPNRPPRTLLTTVPEIAAKAERK